MAGSAQGHKILSGMSAALGDWRLVMNLCCRNHFSFLKAHLAEGVLSDVSVSDAFPGSAILAIHIRSTLILVILAACYGSVFCTVLSICEPRTSGIRAGAFGFSWHAYPPSAVVPGSCSG